MNRPLRERARRPFKCQTADEDRGSYDINYLGKESDPCPKETGNKVDGMARPSAYIKVRR